MYNTALHLTRTILQNMILELTSFEIISMQVPLNNGPLRAKNCQKYLISVIFYVSEVLESRTESEWVFELGFLSRGEYWHEDFARME